MKRPPFVRPRRPWTPTLLGSSGLATAWAAMKTMTATTTSEVGSTPTSSPTVPEIVGHGALSSTAAVSSGTAIVRATSDQTPYPQASSRATPWKRALSQRLKRR